MARLARIVVVDLPHHVTQRGNARQVIFVSDGEREAYLNLLPKHVELYELPLLGQLGTGALHAAEKRSRRRRIALKQFERGTKRYRSALRFE